MSFEAAVAYVNSTSDSGMDNDTKLLFYKLYKQGTVGDCNTPQPGLLDPKGRAKWNAWYSVKGTPSEEAQRLYVAALDEKMPKWKD